MEFWIKRSNCRTSSDKTAVANAAVFGTIEKI